MSRAHHEQGAPRRVVLSTTIDGPERAIAVYARDDEGVRLEVVDAKYRALARSYLDKGAPYDAEGRVVTVAEPDAFMRALAQPARPALFFFRPEPRLADVVSRSSCAPPSAPRCRAGRPPRGTTAMPLGAPSQPAQRPSRTGPSRRNS